MIKYRKFRDQDVKDVAMLMPRVYKEFNSEEATPEKIQEFYDYIDPRKNSNKELLQKIKRPVFFVATDNSKIIGIIRGMPDRVTSLFVEGKYHKQGIGKKLFEFFQKEAIKQDSKSIKVRASLFATSFYEKMGFKKTTGRRRFRGMAIQPMKKTLK